LTATSFVATQQAVMAIAAASLTEKQQFTTFDSKRYRGKPSNAGLTKNSVVHVATGPASEWMQFSMGCL